MGIGRFVYTPILPFMGAALDLPPDEAGLIAAANFLGYLAGALAGAFRALPGSPRGWFLGALLASAVTTAAMGSTGSLPLFLVLRFLGGAASAFVLVFSSALILERLADAGRPGLSAVHFAGVGCGIAFSALLIAALARAGLDWQVMWFASGAATLALLAMSARLVPSAPQAQSGGAPSNAGPSRRMGLDGPLIRLVTAYGLFGFGYVITATFVSVMARTTPGLEEAEAVVWLIVGLSAAPSIFVWSAAARRFGARRAFAFACLMEAIGVAMTAATTAPGPFLVGAALLGGTFMGITALGLTEARSHMSARKTGDPRQILAIMTASFGLGQVIGPWFAGEVSSLTGSFTVPTLAAAAALVVAAGLAWR
ncbi:MAG: YbfB/YjiJ family MFS transporter [Roseibium sp.]|nr:YbfB/YjiJ family MFS transporter [Roseibium sp.]